MHKPLVLPKPVPSTSPKPSNPGGGASSPSPERIAQAIREANDPARLASSSTRTPRG